MTITDDERREVARELRELPIDMYEVLKSWGFEGIDTCCSDQTDYYLIHQAVFGCIPADHMHPCDYEELHMRLADLIDPEPERMCHIKISDCTDSLGQKMYRCSECGSLTTNDACFFEGEPDIDGFSYCPNCGAKVVEG